MSYQRERDQFVARMASEGLPYHIIEALLRAATTLQRYAELSCSSESADRDRVPCPGIKAPNACICDRPFAVLTDEDAANARPGAHDHRTVPRHEVSEARLIARLKATINELNSELYLATTEGDPLGLWQLATQGDPRGYVLRVVPPSYAERNQNRPAHDLDAIGVPARETGLRF